MQRTPVIPLFYQPERPPTNGLCVPLNGTSSLHGSAADKSLMFNERVSIGHACQVIRHSAGRAFAFCQTAKFRRQKQWIGHKLVKAFSQCVLGFAAFGEDSGVTIHFVE